MVESVLNPSFSIEMALAPVAKGNQYQIVHYGRRTSIKESTQAEIFKNAATMLILARMAGCPSPFSKQDKIRMTCFVRHESYRRDLDLGCLKDAIQKSGLIHNDRQIRIEHNEIEDAKGPGRIRLRLEKVASLPWRVT